MTMAIVGVVSRIANAAGVVGSGGGGGPCCCLCCHGGRISLMRLSVAHVHRKKEDEERSDCRYLWKVREWR